MPKSAACSIHVPVAALSRRAFLRAAGVGLSLPLLGAMQPVFARGPKPVPPRRMVLICRGLGLHAPNFFPAAAGRDYEPTPYLKELAEYRDDFTVFSGLSHPEAGGGHSSESSFLTSAPHSGSPAFRNTVSLDQLAAGAIGNQTRYPYLALNTHADFSLSWTRNGVQVPADSDPALVFRRLFLKGSPTEVRAEEQRLQDGRSILDFVNSETAALQRKVGAKDRERLDQYFDSIREVEQRLQNAEAWSRKPKPRVDVPPLGANPDPSDIVGRTEMMFALIHLALQTDSTRLVTAMIPINGGGAPPIKGVRENRHGLSHHGLDPGKLKQLQVVEQAEMRCLRGLLEKLKKSEEPGGTLLDRTMVLYGSNLGNASAHDPRNLPILLVGGGFKHGQHLAFGKGAALPNDKVFITPEEMAEARRKGVNEPLANLFVTMLQRFGLEVDKFGSSIGALKGLEVA